MLRTMAHIIGWVLVALFASFLAYIMHLGGGFTLLHSLTIWWGFLGFLFALAVIIHWLITR